MLGPKHKDLKSISDFNSAWADRLALLILVGLVVDIAAAFILGRTWPENGLTIAANALIIIGVWGELRFAKRAREADDSRVAEANARAAEAQRETERLKAENLIMQGGLRPRRIPTGSSKPRPEEFKDVAEYAGTVALIQSVPGDFEAETLAQDIFLVLSDFGWNAGILSEPDWLVDPRRIHEGVLVVTIEESPFLNGTPKPEPPVISAAGRAADALIAMLNAYLGMPNGSPMFGANWMAEYAQHPFLFHGKPSPPEGAVAVLVGMRPLTFSLPPFSTPRYL
jgi:hypothetical protein